MFEGSLVRPNLLHLAMISDPSRTRNEREAAAAAFGFWFRSTRRDAPVRATLSDVAFSPKKKTIAGNHERTSQLRGVPGTRRGARRGGETGGHSRRRRRCPQLGRRRRRSVRARPGPPLSFLSVFFFALFGARGVFLWSRIISIQKNTIFRI